MASFCETTCPKCFTRITWTGNLVDYPPCEKCGYRIPKEELEKRAAAEEALKNLLFGTDNSDQDLGNIYGSI